MSLDYQWELIQLHSPHAMTVALQDKTVLHLTISLPTARESERQRDGETERERTRDRKKEREE